MADTTAPRPSDPQHQPTAGVAETGTDVDRQATIDELSPASVHISFWQQRWVQSVFPFVTSFLLHAAIVIAGILLATQVQQVYNVIREQIIIPDSTLIEGADIGGIPNPGLGDDPNRANTQDMDANIPVNAASLSNTQVQTLNQSLMGGGSSSEGTNPLAIGPNAGSRGQGGMGTGQGDIGSGAAPFGIPGGGGGVGPKSRFMGTSGNATQILFICDASGSMTGPKLDILKDQIRRSIDSLKPVQFFNVIFFNNNLAIPLDKTRLLAANPEGKRRAYEFLNSVTPGPDSNPIPALQLAFRMQPQLIYFLTDGEFEFALNANDRVSGVLAELNKDGRAKINTIAFVSADEKGALTAHAAPFVELLKKIAADHGGVFKLAAVDEF
ncbi:MAG: hypothetical protein IT448_01190 [Phycisphaerales bacterium]|nr:hypothetical protein [Phycisphaerales bacterium]